MNYAHDKMKRQRFSLNFLTDDVLLVIVTYLTDWKDYGAMKHAVNRDFRVLMKLRFEKSGEQKLFARMGVLLSLNCIVDETFLRGYIHHKHATISGSKWLAKASKLLKLTIKSSAHSTTWKLNSILIRLDIDDCTFCYAGERRGLERKVCLRDNERTTLFSGVRGEETPYLDIFKDNSKLYRNIITGAATHFISTDHTITFYKGKLGKERIHKHLVVGTYTDYFKGRRSHEKKIKREYLNGSVEYFHDDVTYKKELACGSIIYYSRAGCGNELRVSFIILNGNFLEMEGPRNHERCVRMFENGMTHHFEGTFGRERRRHTVNADGSISNRVLHIKNGEKLVYNFNQSDLH